MNENTRRESFHAAHEKSFYKRQIEMNVSFMEISYYHAFRQKNLHNKGKTNTLRNHSFCFDQADNPHFSTLRVLVPLECFSCSKKNIASRVTTKDYEVFLDFLGVVLFKTNRNHNANTPTNKMIETLMSSQDNLVNPSSSGAALRCKPRL